MLEESSPRGVGVAGAAGLTISAWLVWRERGFDRGAGALGLFALQLALNALWSPLFFGLRSPLAGLVDIVPLWAAILGVLVSFWTISPLAGALLVPYWLWVSFATVLNPRDLEIKPVSACETTRNRAGIRLCRMDARASAHPIRREP